MADNDIVIKFKKEEGNIFLESINDSGIEQSYDSSLPLLTINDGTYSKVENPDLNKIISSSVEEAMLRNKEKVDDDFDFSDVYPSQTNEEVIGNPPTKTDVLPSTTEDLAAVPSNEVVEGPTTEEQVVPSAREEVVEGPSNEVVAEGPSNECEQKFNEYNNKITDANCDTIQKDFNKIALKIHPDKNQDCGDASTKSFQLLNNKKEQCDQTTNEPSLSKEDNSIPLLKDNNFLEGGKKNRTKKSKKGGKKKTKRVRFIMTRKGRKNRKNKTRR
jgi:hypothetical protein